MGTERHHLNSVTRVNSNTTTVVQSTGNPGVFDGIVVGVAGSAGSLITAQNSGGSIFAKFDGATVVSHRGLGVAFTDGLTIVSSGATTPDFAVLYR